MITTIIIIRVVIIKRAVKKLSILYYSQNKKNKVKIKKTLFDLLLNLRF